MKILMGVLFVFLNTIMYSQIIFEYDKIEILDTNGEKSELILIGNITINNDTSLIDIEFKGIKNSVKIKNKISTEEKNNHIKYITYDIDNQEEMVIFFHNERVYAVIIHTYINNEYSNIKYIKTKW